MLNLKPNVSKLQKMRYMTFRVYFQNGSKFMEYTYCFGGHTYLLACNWIQHFLAKCKRAWYKGIFEQ